MENLPAKRRSVEELLKKSLSENTQRAYAQALSRLETWLEAQGMELNDPSLTAYLTHLFNEGKSTATAEMALAAVRYRARKSRTLSPIGPGTEMMMASYRREASERGRGQAHGLQWQEVEKIIEKAGADGLIGVRDAAIIAVASDALLRISEVAALQCRDIEFSRDGSGLLTIRKSKTDQEGKGSVHYIGKPTVDALRTWLNESKVNEGPLFRKVYFSKVLETGISPRTIALIIRERSREAGIKGNISGHSTRVGAAQSLAEAGASLVEMQIAGRWTSPNMPAKYARNELATRGVVARLRYGA